MQAVQLVVLAPAAGVQGDVGYSSNPVPFDDVRLGAGPHTAGGELTPDDVIPYTSVVRGEFFWLVTLPH